MSQMIPSCRSEKASPPEHPQCQTSPGRLAKAPPRSNAMQARSRKSTFMYVRSTAQRKKRMARENKSSRLFVLVASGRDRQRRRERLAAWQHDFHTKNEQASAGTVYIRLNCVPERKKKFSEKRISTSCLKFQSVEHHLLLLTEQASPSWPSVSISKNIQDPELPP
jgi:hypothetical protein